MKKNSNIFAIIIIAELCVLAFVGFKMIDRKRVSISIMNKNDIDVKGSYALKHFYEPKPNIISNTELDWLSEKAVNTINHDTLNERGDYSEEKPSDTYRIITLGDSFTYGSYISTVSNWTEVLENKLNSKPICEKFKKIEVINLGVGGYDIDYSLERFRRRGIKYNPDLVIWLLVDNTRILELYHPLVVECSKNYKEDSKNIPTYHCWREAATKIVEMYGNKYINHHLASSFSEIFEIDDSKVLAVDLDNTHKSMLRLVRSNNRMSTMSLEFTKKQELQLPDKHPNIKGHLYFAENLYDHIINNKIISCE